MISRADATTIARREFGGVEEGAIELSEFDEGFVAYARTPRDHVLDHPMIGGTCLVIAKADGRVSAWPELPEEIVIADYMRTQHDDDQHQSR